MVRYASSAPVPFFVRETAGWSRYDAAPGASSETSCSSGASHGSSAPTIPRAVARLDGVAHPRASSTDAPLLSPFDDADALEDLGDEIATLAAHIHAATQRLLVMIADFDQRRGWEIGGHRSCAHWLSFRTGIDLGAAREKVRTARALVALPETSASMARGELSFSKVRAITRVATLENEDDLLEYARGSTTAQLERFVRGFRLGGAKDEAELERIRHSSRRIAVFPGDDGMYVVTGRLDPEIGALLMRAIEAASDALYREDDGPSPEQRRADALALLAERALAVGFGGRPVREGNERGEGHPGDGEQVEREDKGETADRNAPPVSGTRAERYQVLLHVDAETLKGTGDGVHSHLEDGTRVSAETSRRLTCDASVVRVVHDIDGSGRGVHDGGGRGDRRAGPGREPRPTTILDVGRRTRTIPLAIRRALEARDRGCRFPGCGSRFTDAHHVRHWANHGATKLDNLLLLCPHHHRLLHEGGFRVELNLWPGGRVTFYDPRGIPVPEVAPPTRLTTALEMLATRNHAPRADPVQALQEQNRASGVDPVEALREQNRLAGAHPDQRTAGARWKRERDIPRDIWARASETMG